MASPNVYKPIVQGIYTRTASPDYTPPATTRVGKLYTFTGNLASTDIIYQRPAGKRARLVWFAPTFINNSATQEIYVSVDTGIFWISNHPTVEIFNQPPIINAEFSQAINIENTVSVTSVSNGLYYLAFVIVEEDIVNN